jgi:hypothetical protein
MCSLCIFMICFKWYIEGWSVYYGLFHFLLRSYPIIEVLPFPANTPSGFSIGTILNTIFVISNIYYIYVFSTKNLISPSQTKLPWVSAGCTLALMKIYFGGSDF